MEQLLVKLRHDQKAIQDSVFDKLPVDYATFVKQWGVHYGLGQAIRTIEREMFDEQEAEKRS